MARIAPTVTLCTFLISFFFLAIFSIPMILNSFSYSILTGTVSVPCSLLVVVALGKIRA